MAGTTRPRRKGISPRVRFEIFKRDHFTCQYCGRKAPDVELRVDHRISVRHHGPHTPENFVTACFDCNAGKGDIPLHPDDDYTKGWGWGEIDKTKAVLRRIGARHGIEMLRKLERSHVEWCATQGEFTDISPSEYLTAIEQTLLEGGA